MQDDLVWPRRFVGCSPPTLLSQSPRRSLRGVWKVQRCPELNFQRHSGLDLPTMGWPDGEPIFRDHFSLIGDYMSTGQQFIDELGLI